ncbi:MAG: hypothetical protein FWG63_04420 [Defluviitaleaceae bacterium]|nr:hypothetical protein [Defluviitaleaceae bacterium]
MIKKTNNNEIITLEEAQEKYAKLYFRYFQIESNLSQPGETKIVVVYTADTEEEIYASPQYDDNGNRIYTYEGHGAGDSTVMQLGGVYIV